MSTPLIRTARPEDAGELAVLDHATWSPQHAVQPRPEPPFAPFFDVSHPPEDYLVAVVDGAVAGYIRLGFPSPLACNRHVRQIQGLSVAESARGHGVGRSLLRAACDKARTEGARRITLRVLGHNTPARTLYASEGFATEGLLPGEFLFDADHGDIGYVDDVLMGRSL